jgi:hypothetical protein
MEILPLVRMLWRRRLPLAIGALVALAAAVAIGSPRAETSAIAWTRVALDTPKSQLVKSAPAGADSLPWRAFLLVHQMGTDEVQRQLAERLRVRPEDVAVVDSVLATPTIMASMPKRAADAAAVTAAPYVLTVDMKNSSLPLISIEATAPDRVGAAQLATAAVGVLEARASTGETRYKSPILTGGGAARKTQAYLVQQAATIHTKAVTPSALPATQIGVAFVLFGLWCAGAILLPPLLRRRTPRSAAA